MSTRISLQRAGKHLQHPPATQIRTWIKAVLQQEQRQGDVAVYLVDEAELADLNQTWRGKTGPTNVLSFPAGLPPGAPVQLLGDIAICVPVLEQEAAAQGKPLQAHWAHLLIHGTLHLLGYDHEVESEAEQMEQRETALLAGFGFADPYR